MASAAKTTKMKRARKAANIKKRRSVRSKADLRRLKKAGKRATLTA